MNHRGRLLGIAILAVVLVAGIIGYGSRHAGPHAPTEPRVDLGDGVVVEVVQYTTKYDANLKKYLYEVKITVHDAKGRWRKAPSLSRGLRVNFEPAGDIKTDAYDDRGDLLYIHHSEYSAMPPSRVVIDLNVYDSRAQIELPKGYASGECGDSICKIGHI